MDDYASLGIVPGSQDPGTLGSGPWELGPWILGSRAPDPGSQGLGPHLEPVSQDPGPGDPVLGPIWAQIRAQKWAYFGSRARLGSGANPYE